MYKRKMKLSPIHISLIALAILVTTIRTANVEIREPTMNDERTRI